MARRKGGALAALSQAAKTTGKALKVAKHVCQGERCTACGSVGEVGWVDRKAYGRGCGHYRKMAQSGGLTVARAVKRDGNAKAAVPSRGKPGGPAVRGRHRDGQHAAPAGTPSTYGPGRHRSK